jgi:HD superfamily phosphohydrolase
MRLTKPWGLAREWLEPYKQITDPVHGNIYLTYLETRLADTPPLQRLRRVRQLGTTHLVYPGATHSRFAHVLGALRVAQDLLDGVIDQRSGPSPVKDLFTQWREDAPYEYDRRLAEATVLARLGALLHDLCHVPFGHSIEDDLKILDPHDRNRARFDRLWAMLDGDVRKALESDARLLRNLTPLILSKEPPAGAIPPAYPFVYDIVGNTICADLLDYLRRDHLYTGLPLALGRRFEAGFYVTPIGDPDLSARMALRIVRRNGAERVDAVTELLKHLRYRYELSERVLVHHAKLAADAMVGKALEMWYDALLAAKLRSALAGQRRGGAGRGGSVPNATRLDALRDAARRRLGDDRVDELAGEAKGEVDVELCQRGDDAMLEYLRDLRPETSGLDVKRVAAINQLAAGILNRTLFKPVAQQSETRGPRADFYAEHGDSQARRRLEEDAARFAGLERAWQILIWLPSPTMRLKVAEVLVDDGDQILPFVERERRGQRRGIDIYEAHENLWAVSVFVDPRVDARRARQALARLSAQMRVPLGGLETELGDRPYEWPDRLAIREAKKRRKRRTPREADLLAVRLGGRRAARGAGRSPTFEALVSEYEQLL